MAANSTQEIAVQVEKKSATPEISVKAEPIFNIYGFKLTNSLFASIFVLIIFFLLALKYHKDAGAKKRTGFFYGFNMVIKMIYDLFASILGDKIDYFFPLLGTFFLFILFNNWFGLLPGVGSVLIKITEHGKNLMVPILRGNNADLNTTIVLGLISVILIQFFGIKFLGFKEYSKKFFNLSNPLNFVVGILELISEISKVISFSFRLFGNIFAGEVLLTIIAFLIPIAASFPFLLLELFVGVIQALVFAMLTAVFLSMAIQKQH